MGMPHWWGQINKRVFNPRVIRKRTYPVVTHRGRHSGSPHQTPLDAQSIAGGFVIPVIYGPNSDWLKNILASGNARVTTRDGEVFELANPRLLTRTEVQPLLPDGANLPPEWMRVNDYLVLDTV